MSGTKKTIVLSGLPKSRLPQQPDEQPWQKPPLRLPSPDEIAAARAAGKQRQRTEERAIKAHLYRSGTRITIELASGVEFSFPVGVLRELKGARKSQLTRLQLLDDGRTLAWPELDVHISVTGLLLDLIGQDTLRAEINRRVATSRSLARTLASRANGKKGGRPRKVPQSLP